MATPKLITMIADAQTNFLSMGAPSKVETGNMPTHRQHDASAAQTSLIRTRQYRSPSTVATKNLKGAIVGYFESCLPMFWQKMVSFQSVFNVAL
jgi:hypothetical protein